MMSTAMPEPINKIVADYSKDSVIMFLDCVPGDYAKITEDVMSIMDFIFLSEEDLN